MEIKKDIPKKQFEKKKKGEFFKTNYLYIKENDERFETIYKNNDTRISE